MCEAERHLAPARPPAAGVNRFGDLVCPHCGVNVVTPPGAIVVEGVGACPVCTLAFSVPARVARWAGRRAWEWARRTAEARR